MLRKRRITSSPTWSCSKVMAAAIARMIPKPRRVGFTFIGRAGGTLSGGVGAHCEGRRQEGSAREPRQPTGGNRRSVDPRRQDGEERQHAVEVVEIVGDAPAVGQKEKSHRHLRDQK